MQTRLQAPNVSQSETTTQAKSINDFSTNGRTLQRHAALTNSVIQCVKWIGNPGGWHIHDEGGTHIKFGNDGFSRVDFDYGMTWDDVQGYLLENYQGKLTRKDPETGKTVPIPITIDTLKKKDPTGWKTCEENFPKVMKKLRYL